MTNYTEMQNMCKLQDLPDTHVSLIYETIVQQCIGAAAYHADQ